MKKLLVITALLTAFAMTGCTPNGSTTDSYPLLVKTTEITGNDVYVTEFEYDSQTGALVGETKSLGSNILYEIEDYKFESSTWTRYRTTYNSDGTTVRHKLVSFYGASIGYEAKETKFEIFREENGQSILEEVREISYGEFGESGFKQTVNGTVVLERKNYDYSGNSGSSPFYTYTEVKDGGEGVLMCKKGTEIYGDTIVGYEIWANWNGSSGNLVEKQANYNETSTDTSYTITRYDAEGNGTSTSVTNEYRIFTITY